MLALAGLLATAACANNEPTPRVEKPHGAFRTYVAMGDSNTAGPGISPMDPGSGLCARAKKNYPALLAKELKISSVRDVSCTAARTDDIIKMRPITSQVPGAMLDAVTPDTDLVTVSMGANDGGAWTGILVFCLLQKYGAKNCGVFIDTMLDAILRRTVKRLASALKRIKAKAPEARIVLVGYLPIFPKEGGCVMADLDPARVAPARAGLLEIERTFKKAAKRADVEFVSFAKRGAGHQSCDGDRAWVTGIKTVKGVGMGLHPNAAGMRAVAKILAAYLTK
jgi:lysophospholipase L1-like esterase